MAKTEDDDNRRKKIFVWIRRLFRLVGKQRIHSYDITEKKKEIEFL